MKKNKRKVLIIVGVVLLVTIVILALNLIKVHRGLDYVESKEEKLSSSNGVNRKASLENSKSENTALKENNETSSKEENQKSDEKENITENDSESETQETKNYVEGEAIVIEKPEQKVSLFSAIKKEIGKNSAWDNITVYKEVDFGNNNGKGTYRIQSNNENKEDLKFLFVKSETLTTQQIIDQLKDNVYWVQPNFKYSLCDLTNDIYLKYQWALDNSGQFGGQEGNDINPIQTNSDKQKVIAVLDSGIDYNNEDLKDVMWKDSEGNTGYDFKNEDSDPMDDYEEAGHGTACAGIIAASSNNGKGITGALLKNSNIKIMNLKVTDNKGSALSSDIIEAYNYMLEQQKNNANIIAANLSLGGKQEIEDQASLEIINRAGQNGILSICAAGNDAEDIDNEHFYPAGLNSDYIVSVAASDGKGQLCKGFSNYGKEKVDLAAPGENIFSTALNTDTWILGHTEEEMNELVDFYSGYDSKESLVKDQDYFESTQVDEDTVNSNINLELDSNVYFGTGTEGKSLKLTKKDTSEGYILILPIQVKEARRIQNFI